MEENLKYFKAKNESIWARKEKKVWAENFFGGGGNCGPETLVRKILDRKFREKILGMIQYSSNFPSGSPMLSSNCPSVPPESSSFADEV